MKVIIVMLTVVNFVFCQQKDDVVRLINRSGYKGESHQVETEDGYLLTVHHIPPSGGSPKKFPVFLQHGLIVTSVDWVIAGPKRALAYYLADAGYDVWMGNTRGSKHSMNHRNLSIDSPEFWTFSFNEMGMYDLPAMIDHVLNQTGASQTFYVGHSQGGSTFLVCMSMRPEYNAKIVHAHLLAPAAFMNHVPHPAFSSLAAEIRKNFFRNYMYVDLSRIWDVGSELAKMFCVGVRTPLTTTLCEAVIFVTVGPNKKGIELDRKIVKALVPYMSPRISTNQMVHYAQLYYSGNFESFDYRWRDFSKRRRRTFKSSRPVRYALENISTPIYLYRGADDVVIGKTVSKVTNMKHRNGKL